MMGNYRPSGRGPELIAIYAFFVVFTTVAIILRIYVRGFLARCVGYDDWVAVFGWLSFIFYTGFAIAGVFHGTGQHEDLIHPKENIPIGLKWWWACEPLYVISNLAIKLSIALMLLRLVVREAHRVLICIVTATVTLYSVGYFFIFIFQCYPPSFFWTRMQGRMDGTCLDTAVVVNATYAYSVLACLSDLTYAILPWFMVRKLQMNLRSKILVAIILSLGSIASIATIIRTPYISTMSNTTDFLYATTDVAIWSAIETGVGIIASSAATLKPLLNTWIERSGFFADPSTQLRPDDDIWPKGRRSERRSYTCSEGSLTALPTSRERDSMPRIKKTFAIQIRHCRDADEPFVPYITDKQRSAYGLR